jgi:hypothetical protein
MSTADGRWFLSAIFVAIAVVFVGLGVEKWNEWRRERESGRRGFPVIRRGGEDAADR